MAAETLVENMQRLEFKVLCAGDTLDITTGRDDEAWKYNFLVKDAAYWPSGTLKEVNPDGETTGFFEFAMHGCGRWTDRRQNPVQTQERAFTPYYEGLIVGSFMWGKLEGAANRSSFDKRGQEISEITRTPYRENAVLQAMGSQIGPVSVRQIAELIQDAKPPIDERDLRTTLGGLAGTGLVSELRKKVLKYELSAGAQ